MNLSFNELTSTSHIINGQYISVNNNETYEPPHTNVTELKWQGGRQSTNVVDIRGLYPAAIKGALAGLSGMTRP